MSNRMTPNSPGSMLRVIILTLLFLVIFVLTLVLAAFLLLGPQFRLSPEGPAPGPNPTPTAEPELLVTPVAGSLVTLRSVPLGIAVDYPANWAKQEKTLRVIFSPSPAGLDPANLQDAALWVGIPADNTYNPDKLLQNILAGFPAGSQITGAAAQTIAGQSWQSARIMFQSDSLGGPARAIVAATGRDEVGYYLVAVAPADRWDALNPVFQGIINSLRFTAEAVIRPTEATRPPTPTPTPTPRIYVVQSGDTLSAIALQFNVSVEALAARNGIEDPRALRAGQKLIIPTRR